MANTTVTKTFEELGTNDAFMRLIIDEREYIQAMTRLNNDYTPPDGWELDSLMSDLLPSAFFRFFYNQSFSFKPTDKNKKDNLFATYSQVDVPLTQMTLERAGVTSIVLDINWNSVCKNGSNTRIRQQAKRLLTCLYIMSKDAVPCSLGSIASEEYPQFYVHAAYQGGGGGVVNRDGAPLSPSYLEKYPAFFGCHDIDFKRDGFRYVFSAGLTVRCGIPWKTLKPKKKECKINKWATTLNLPHSESLIKTAKAALIPFDIADLNPRIVEGDEVSKIYVWLRENCKLSSCMAHTLDQTAWFAKNPEHIKLCYGHSEDHDQAFRCLLWYANDGYVYADRLYQVGCHDGRQPAIDAMYKAIQEYFQIPKDKFIALRATDYRRRLTKFTHIPCIVASGDTAPKGEERYGYLDSMGIIHDPSAQFRDLIIVPGGSSDRIDPAIYNKETNKKIYDWYGGTPSETWHTIRDRHKEGHIQLTAGSQKGNWIPEEDSIEYKRKVWHKDDLIPTESIINPVNPRLKYHIRSELTKQHQFTGLSSFNRNTRITLEDLGYEYLITSYKPEVYDKSGYFVSQPLFNPENKAPVEDAKLTASECKSYYTLSDEVIEYLKGQSS